MLVCNAGMSTGILAKKIEEASDGKLECKAYGEAEYLDHIKDCLLYTSDAADD